jgi:molybdenum cofactor biosynthesis enzyme MoaA
VSALPDAATPTAFHAPVAVAGYHGDPVRVVRILTNETCDHRCRFCNTRREHERADVASRPALQRKIDESLRREPAEIVLTGGEPSLRRDLPGIVAQVRQRGSASIVLESNGSGIDSTMAARLAAAGLDRVRVHLPGWGDRLNAIAGHDAAWSNLQRAALASTEAGLELEASIPIARSNLEDTASLPEHILDAGWPIRRLIVSIPLQAPRPDALAPVSDAVVAVQRLAEAARARGIAVVLDPATFVPPCLFERPAAVAHLYALNEGSANRRGWQRTEACTACVVADRCPGLPEGVAGIEPRPIRRDHVRRRLSVISSIDEQIEREVVTHELGRRPDGTTVPTSVVRVNFHCNQACWFCFVSTHLPPAPAARIHDAIDDIGRRGGVLVLSGGEPTLHPDLPTLVRRGKAAGAREVELQTNAVRLADPTLVQAVAEAGVDVAFVSLHGACAETSDAITRAPGTFERTVLGLDNLSHSAIAVRINFVLCRPNHREFPDFVRLVASRWPRASLTVSFVALSTDLVPRSRDLVPRYADIVPDLERGLAIAAQHGVAIEGFDSMCGIPLCLVPVDRGRFAALAPIPAGYDGGEFIRADACRRCVLEDRCFGLRRGYAAMYGTSELVPIDATGAPATSPSA